MDLGLAHNPINFEYQCSFFSTQSLFPILNSAGFIAIIINFFNVKIIFIFYMKL